jgi:hypothetical protein
MRMELVWYIPVIFPCRLRIPAGTPPGQAVWRCRCCSEMTPLGPARSVGVLIVKTFYSMKFEKRYRNKRWLSSRNMSCRHTGGVDVRLYSFLTLALDGGVGGQCHAPAALPPRKRHGTHCTGGCMGPRTGLSRCAEEIISCVNGVFEPWSIAP